MPGVYDADRGRGGQHLADGQPGGAEQLGVLTPDALPAARRQPPHIQVGADMRVGGVVGKQDVGSDHARAGARGGDVAENGPGLVVPVVVQDVGQDVAIGVRDGGGVEEVAEDNLAAAGQPAPGQVVPRARQHLVAFEQDPVQVRVRLQHGGQDRAAAAAEVGDGPRGGEVQSRDHGGGLRGPGGHELLEDLAMVRVRRVPAVEIVARDVGEDRLPGAHGGRQPEHRLPGGRISVGQHGRAHRAAAAQRLPGGAQRVAAAAGRHGHPHRGAAAQQPRHRQGVRVTAAGELRRCDRTGGQLVGAAELGERVQGRVPPGAAQYLPDRRPRRAAGR